MTRLTRNERIQVHHNYISAVSSLEHKKDLINRLKRSDTGNIPAYEAEMSRHMTLHENVIERVLNILKQDDYYRTLKDLPVIDELMAYDDIKVKKASKRKLTSDVKTADPQPSTSKDESASTQCPPAETISEQQPEDAPITEQQQESETGSEQQTQDDSTSTQQTHDDSTSTLQSQDESVLEQQQQHASDTLTSPSSDDSHSPLPDYGSELKLFTTKDPHSIPKKPRCSLHPKPE